MAYAVHFRFKWSSDNDNVYQIDILEDGYSGSIVKRPLGGAPQLRRNRNGNICGTSLEFQAQAQVDGEFACLFAVSATAYRVDLYRGSSLIWQGFITPELYSEPYIAPPYNVRVTATDNLGELKLSDYTAQGRVTVSTLLSTILAKTGLSFSVHWLSRMHPEEQASVAAANMPAGVLINLDHLAGETYYDVLTKMLDTFHAFIVQYNCSWLIVRETDLEALRSNATITAPDGTTFSIGDFGSMSNKIWWPVGYLSQTVVAAKKKKVITAPNAWVANLLSSTPSSSENATLVSPTDGSTPYYELTPWTWNGSGNVPGSASLTIQTGFDDFVPVKDITLRLTMQFWGILVNISGMTAKHGKCGALKVKLTASDGSSYIYRWLGADGSISTTEVEAMSINDSFDEVPQDIYLNIPVYSKMSEGGWTRIYQIQVTYASYTSEGTVTRLYIYTDWNLNIAEQNKGYQVTCLLNNGARGEAEETTIAAADNTDKNLEKLFVQNGFKYSNTVSGHYLESIEEWASSNISSMPLLEFLARDYCLSIAVPRLRMEGTMNVPASTALPLLFRGGGLIYWPETWDWNLETDRLDISMLSLPASAITVTSVTRTAQGSGGVITGGGGTPSGGGGGGGTGDGTVTSVAVTVPTGLTVTGSPITTNGTIAIALAEGYSLPLTETIHTHSNKSVLDGITAAQVAQWDAATPNTGTVTSVTVAVASGSHLSVSGNTTITGSGTVTIGLASGYGIPTTSKMSNWDTAYSSSHSHSNKSVLDGITSTKVSNWDTAYTDRHTHSNKSVLDGITSGNVSNWSSAYSAAVTYRVDNASDITDGNYNLVTANAIYDKFNGSAAMMPVATRTSNYNKIANDATGDTYLATAGAIAKYVQAAKPTALNDLSTDVSIAGPSNGDFFCYSSSLGKWTNVTASNLLQSMIGSQIGGQAGSGAVYRPIYWGGSQFIAIPAGSVASDDLYPVHGKTVYNWFFGSSGVKTDSITSNQNKVPSCYAVLQYVGKITDASTSTWANNTGCLTGAAMYGFLQESSLMPVSKYADTTYALPTAAANDGYFNIPSETGTGNPGDNHLATCSLIYRYLHKHWWNVKDATIGSAAACGLETAPSSAASSYGADNMIMTQKAVNYKLRNYITGTVSYDEDAVKNATNEIVTGSAVNAALRYYGLIS